MELTQKEERWVRSMNGQIDALIGVELEQVGHGRFFPEKLSVRVANAYALPGSDNGSDPRGKVVKRFYIHKRVMRLLRGSKKGLRLFIPIGGGQWQWAAATFASQVRVFRNNYREIQQSAGAKREALDAVLEDHRDAGRTDDDLITEAYERALA